MAEKQSSKPEIAPQKRIIKFSPAIGDWTVYKPPRVIVKKIKTGLYGFDRLSKEEINQFLFIHYNFIKKLLRHFKVDLGMAVELYSVSVEQNTYLNFLRSLATAMVQGKINMADSHEPVHTFFELSQANSIINYALGSRDLEPLSRGLTEAESNILATTFSEYLPDLSAAFENCIKKLTFSVVGSPEIMLDQSINPSLTLASFSAELSLAENGTGKIIFAYPAAVLKALLACFKEKQQGKALNFSRLPGGFLAKIKAPLSARLGETELTTNEINQLEIGDVVSLTSSIDSPISVDTSEALKALGQPGLKNKKYAVRLVGFEESVEIEVPKPELTSFAKEKEETEGIAPPAEEAPEEFHVEETEEEEFPEEELKEQEFGEEEFTEEGFGEEGEGSLEEEPVEGETLEEEPLEEEFSEEEFTEEFPEEETGETKEDF